MNTPSVRAHQAGRTPSGGVQCASANLSEAGLPRAESQVYNGS